MLRFALLGILVAVCACKAVAAEPNYGGFKDIKSEATGYFRVEKIGDKWWCIDPAGLAYFAIGTDHVNYNVHWCEALGYAPYAKNVREKFKNDESAWAQSCVDRLKHWNFNLLGANNSPSTRGRGLAYTHFLGLGAEYAGKDPIVDKVHWTGFPNVFSPAYAEHCKKRAREACAPLKDDPWLFGWFLDNELEWYGKSLADTGLADEAIKRPAEHSAKHAFVEMLRSKYTGISRLNAAWGTHFKEWQEARESTAWNEQDNGYVKADKKSFIRLCAEKYFSITTAAIKEADPNHMIIGCRFAGRAPDVWDIAGKYCDIVSLNYYGMVDLQTLKPKNLVEDLTRWHKASGRPLMITEWSFPALDAGLPCIHGAGMRVRTQQDKAKCFEVYQKTFFSLPFVVGSAYFMWVDEPAQGISKTFPEDSNYGLVDVNDEPWQVFVQTVTRVNAQACQIRTGKTTELSFGSIGVKDGKLEIGVRNRGSVPAVVQVKAEIDGKPCPFDVPVLVKDEQRTSIGEKLSPGAHYIEAEIDPKGSHAELGRGDNKLSKMIYTAGEKPEGALLALGVVSKAGGKTAVVMPLKQITGLPKSQGTIKPFLLLAQDGAETSFEVLDVDDSGTLTPDDELVFEADLKASAAQTFYLRIPSGDASVSLVAPKQVEEFSIDNGKLSLVKGKASGALVDTIKLEGVQMGSLDALMQQVAGATYWTRPDRVTKITLWQGKAYTRAEITAVRQDCGPDDSQACRFETVYQLGIPAGRSSFTARFCSLKNTDTRPWQLSRYFYYPLSSIGGSPENDEPGLPGLWDSAGWINRKVGCCYGIHAPAKTQVELTFWKDDNGGQHPDARKLVEKRLNPGETYVDSAEPVTLILGRIKDSAKPWEAFDAEINALPKVEVFKVSR